MGDLCTCEVNVQLVMQSPSLSDVRQYYSRHMAYVPAQPRVRRDVLASLLERNANEVAAQQEWETEWNTHGLTSRLTEEVRGASREGVEGDTSEALFII